MNEHRDGKIRCSLQYFCESRIVRVTSGHVSANLHCVKSHSRDALQLADRQFGTLHRHSAGGEESIRMRGYRLCDEIVLVLRECCGCFRRTPIAKEDRNRGKELTSHPVMVHVRYTAHRSEALIGDAAELPVAEHDDR